MSTSASAAAGARGTLCEYYLGGEIDPQALLPMGGPSLHELFPLDLLYRGGSTLPMVIFEKLDHVALYVALNGISLPAGAPGSLAQHPARFEPLLFSAFAYLRSAPERAQFGYGWLDGELARHLVPESPITLLPREIQADILARVARELRHREDQEAKLLRRRVDFLRQQAELTPMTLRGWEEGTGRARTTSQLLLPADVREELGEGLIPLLPPVRFALKEFYDRFVRPRLPLTASEYLSLLSEHVKIVPIVKPAKTPRGLN